MYLKHNNKKSTNEKQIKKLFKKIIDEYRSNGKN
tara:strand:+ start:1328 stop:1429 length:102 start_codon:yes stop_codon:yes gene_type:complete